MGVQYLVKGQYDGAGAVGGDVAGGCDGRGETVADGLPCACKGVVW